MVTLTGAERLLRACRRQPVDATPVWFMRQAGRCLAEHRALRDKYDILTLAKTPELCAQVSVMPVDALGVDAAVMYTDIMLPMEGMGISYVLDPAVGPIIDNPVRTAADVERLRVVPAQKSTPYVFDAIRIVRETLGDRAAVVGITGAPFTLACYLIEGRPSRDFAKAKALMFGAPTTWHRLMDALTEVVVSYVVGQAAAGAHAVQVFDSWAGALSPEDYREYVLPYSRRIFDALRPTGVPTIHFATGAGGILGPMAEAGSDVIAVDWRVALDDAWEEIGDARAIQGNLDPTLLVAPFEQVARGTRRVLQEAGGRPGHIFNLGHGVLAETSPDTLRRLVEFVHAETATAGVAG